METITDKFLFRRETPYVIIIILLLHYYYIILILILPEVRARKGFSFSVAHFQSAYAMPWYAYAVST